MAGNVLSSLRIARMFMGETQDSLAIRTQVDPRTYRRFEAKEYAPDRQYLARVSHALGLPIVSAESPGTAANNFAKQLEDVWNLVSTIREITYDDYISEDQADLWETVRQQVAELVIAGATLLEVPYEQIKKTAPQSG